MNSIQEINELDQNAVKRVRADVQRICDDIPSRLAGSDNGRRMAEYSAAGLREIGLDAQVHELPGLVSFPGPGSIEVSGPQQALIAANTLGHSVQTPPEGVRASIVDVGAGGDHDYAGKDVRGKIVLVELSYHPGRHEKQRIAAERGAVGCVMMNWGPPDSAVLPFGSVKPAWGNPTPDTFRHEMAVLPCIGISRVSGLQLRGLLARGEVGGLMRTSVENGWRPVHVTTADLTVAGSDDFVVIGGHQDSWQGPQATDNAAGNACMLELARFFTRHRAKLRRGVTFGFWTGHETGTMIGSTWYVDRHWDRIRRHAVAYLQIDQPACAGTTRWGSVSNSELRQFQQQTDEQMLGDIPRAWRRSVKVGDASFFGIGVPMFAGQGVYTADELKASANANLGWWHHSLENTIDKLEWPNMGLHLRMYAAYVWTLCTAPVIPCDFTAVAQDMLTRLSELMPSGGPVMALQAVAKRCEVFVACAAHLADAAARVTLECDREAVGSELRARTLNTALKRLSRLLLPITGTVKGAYGHDPYAYTPQTTMLPSLYFLPQWAALPAGEEKWMLETQLLRERNRIADAIDDAIALIEQSLMAVS